MATVKVIRKYTPYLNGKWNQAICDKMKKETGFDPGPQKDDIVLGSEEFLKAYLANIPNGKILKYDYVNHATKGTSCLNLVIEEYVEE